MQVMIKSIAELKNAIGKGEQVTYAGVSVLSFKSSKITLKEDDTPFIPWLPALRIIRE